MSARGEDLAVHTGKHKFGAQTLYFTLKSALQVKLTQANFQYDFFAMIMPTDAKCCLDICQDYALP